MDRREFLALAAGIPALAGCGGGGRPDAYGDWFANVDNHDAEVDRRARDRVTVAVGADDGFAFAPAAIRVDAGTTVRWVWTGIGGRHNVVDEYGAFASDYHRESGATYEYTFEAGGLYPYFCEPHRAMGMKGGVRVV